MGLGKVGRSTLSRALHNAKAFPIYWVADSRSVLSSESEPFTPKAIRAIIDLKAKGRSLSCHREELQKARLDEFLGPRQEMRILRSLLTTKEEWLILDSAPLPPADDYETAKAMMGVAGFCTANKTSWADYGLCSDLYSRAESSETFLGLNCTTGVWVDQMESLPLVMKYHTKGRLTITKRDNSSLNLFFARVDSSMEPDDAMKEIERAGYLEPGAKGFSKEVHDQIFKARISANICGVLRRVKPRFVDQTATGRDRPHSMSPADVARWHREGDGKSGFKALVTRVVLDQGQKERLECTVSFDVLPRESPLARHFLGKNAIHIESTGLPAMPEDGKQRASMGYFHSGYGGAERTAAKLLWEAERIASLRTFKGRAPFNPLPVLFAENLGNESEARLRRVLAASLG